MSWRAALLPVAFLSLTPIVGCAARSAESGEAAAQPRTTVIVDNRNTDNVNVYVVRDGTRAHLGLVLGQRRRTLRVPPDFMLGGFIDVQVAVDAVGGGSYLSQRVRLYPGDEIDLFVSDNIRNSRILVRGS